MQSDTAPMSGQERIDSLDLLRGFALLGILLMNIQSFAMPSAAYTNPAAFGDLTGVNQWTWIFSHVLADQKFMSIFSMLFGAGVCIFAERAEHRRGGALGLHYRRMAWLLAFGLIHAHLLWYGDILYSYALCGFLLYWFRRCSPRRLLWFSAGFLLIPMLYNGVVQLSMGHMPAEALEGIRESWLPEPGELEREVAAYTGSWMEQQAQRHETAVMLETLVFSIHFFWRAMSMMLLGMALYKLHVFHARRLPIFYGRFALIGIPLGIGLSAWGVDYNFSHDWQMEQSMFAGGQFNYLGSVATALGYVGLVMLWAQSSRLRGLRSRLQAAGRMAFSNYIAQTLICTFLFYGFGLGWFGDVSRWQQLLVVLGVWVIQLIYSPLWLAHFRFGPLEWLWRALSYLQLPAMRRERVNQPRH